MPDRTLDAAVAVTRFGLGARPGEIAEAAGDPRGWVRAQVRREGADPLPDPPSGRWPDVRDRYCALRDFRQAYQEVRLETAALRSGSGAPGDLAAMAPDPATASAAMASPGMTPPAPAMRRAMTLDTTPAAGSDAMRRRRELYRPLAEATAAELLARMQLAATTPAGFRERWTLFWSNHFTVAAKNQQVAVIAPVFEREAIRPYVFGRFADLLFASITHPGMMAYLDQTQSVGPNSPVVQRAAYRPGGGGARRVAGGLNENLAREVLELHTVGADAGYTQADVTEFARALTGYSIGAGRAQDGELGAAVFREAAHEPGARTVMGRTYREGEAGQARAIVEDLAADPRTARRLARKLAIHFVSDDPDPALVARLERAYLASHGDLGRVALALADAPEAWAGPARKLKTPYEFLVSSWRATGASPARPAQEVVQPLTVLGQPPFGARQPNGFSDQAVDWAAPDAVVKRLVWAQGFAAAHAPSQTPVEVGEAALGARLTPATRTALARAETRAEGVTLLLMSPEFQRR